jgi:MFS family permease
MGLHASGTSDPPAVRNWTIHWIALVASMAAMALGYDTAVIGGTMSLESYKMTFGIDDSVSASVRDAAQANITSMFQLPGAFLGALLTFPIADKIGRRRAILMACLIFMVGGVMMTASGGNLNIFIAGRAIGGFGVGSATLTVPLYIAEISPPSIRGRLVGIFEVVSQASGMLGFWINYATDATISDSNQAQWLIPTALQLFPVTVLAFGIFVCPESPRWLAREDRYEDAEKVLVYLRQLPADSEYVQAEMAEIREQMEERSTSHMGYKAQFKKIITPGNRNRVAVGAFLMFLQSFTGTNASLIQFFLSIPVCLGILTMLF